MSQRKGQVSAIVYSLISSLWTRASVVMHDILRSRRVPYVHVVQPNQYHSKTRFSRDEERVAMLFYFSGIGRVLKPGSRAIVTFFLLDATYRAVLDDRTDRASRFHILVFQSG